MAYEAGIKPGEFYEYTLKENLMLCHAHRNNNNFFSLVGATNAWLTAQVDKPTTLPNFIQKYWPVTTGLDFEGAAKSKQQRLVDKLNERTGKNYKLS